MNRLTLTKLVAGTVVVSQLTACGTILYPERKGQSAGHLDPGVVALDAVGLLLYFVPGIIAFAVDFSNGTIYLPGGDSVVLKVDERVPLNGDESAESVGPQLLTLLEARGVIPANVNAAALQREPLSTPADLRVALTRHAPLTLAAATSLPDAGR